MNRYRVSIHPKEYQRAVNRGYSMSETELAELREFYEEFKNRVEY